MKARLLENFMLLGHLGLQLPQKLERKLLRAHMKVSGENWDESFWKSSLKALGRTKKKPDKSFWDISNKSFSENV
jgi:hypothetical protein